MSAKNSSIVENSFLQIDKTRPIDRVTRAFDESSSQEAQPTKRKSRKTLYQQIQDGAKKLREEFPELRK